MGSTQSIRGLQHQGKASPLREKKDKENRPGRVPSAVPRDTPRKGPPMSEFSPRKAPPVAKREPSPFVLEPIGALLMEENYDITDKENSDDDEDLDRSKKLVPNWVRGWPSRVKAQGDLDPDAIFGPIPQCSLERIFRDPASVAARANRAWRPRALPTTGRRTSSARPRSRSTVSAWGRRAKSPESSRTTPGRRIQLPTTRLAPNASNMVGAPRILRVGSPSFLFSSLVNACPICCPQ